MKTDNNVLATIRAARGRAFDITCRTLCPALAASLLIAGYAAAPVRAQAPDTVKACYVNGSGTIYRTNAPNAPNECTRNTHVPMTWPGGKGDDYPRYLLAEGVRRSPNGFAVTGTMGQGTIPASGAGTRLMWYPRKGAFRAGSVNGSQWDDSSIGPNSVALNNSTTASGTNSTALGFLTTASGYNATALGENTTASGARALVAGLQSAATGPNAIAVGYRATASDQNSIAVGYETVAGGSQSTAFGSNSAATGQSSTALGNYTTASRFASLATGNRTIASGEYSTAMGSYAATNGKLGAFVYGDASSSALVAAQVNNQFVVRAQHIWLGANNNVTFTQGRYIQVANGAYLSTGGTWTNSSDVNRKHHFQLVNGEDVLQKIAALPIRTWSYKDDHASVRHMGPTAQDFHRAFGLGDSDRAIATVDGDGIALAAIQALEQRTRELQSTSGEIAQLRRDNAELRAALAELSQRLNTLEARR